MWHQICDHWKKQSKSNISYKPGALWDKVIDFKDEPVVQCNVPAVKYTFLDDDDDNDDCKQMLMGTVNILFLELILCIAFLYKLNHEILFSHYYFFHSGFFDP